MIPNLDHQPGENKSTENLKTNHINWFAHRGGLGAPHEGDRVPKIEPQQRNETSRCGAVSSRVLKHLLMLFLYSGLLMESKKYMGISSLQRVIVPTSI